jgi:two-component system CheB/CheR fusion protein
MSFPVVGIGASAGGLAAFEAFFSAMPSDHESGMAFVLVQHLAPDQRERAICIVLSGTGSDGTLGVRAVKGEGGMVMAQDPDSADYDGMPRSAIATGLVDYVLPPAAMPARLVAYVARAFGKMPRPVSAPIPPVHDTLRRICGLLRTQTGHDFSQYEETTIVRRVEWRMAIHQMERLDDYLRLMQQNPAEVDSLFCDLLISVTNFFRDPEAFEALRTQVIPGLFAGKPAIEAVRVWVCGCSTGERPWTSTGITASFSATKVPGSRKNAVTLISRSW